MAISFCSFQFAQVWKIWIINLSVPSPKLARPELVDSLSKLAQLTPPLPPPPTFKPFLSPQTRAARPRRQRRNNNKINFLFLFLFLFSILINKMKKIFWKKIKKRKSI